jgi:hypothetical protein
MKKNVPFGTAIIIIIIVAVVAGLIWFRATGQEPVATPMGEPGGRAPAEAGFQAREEPTPGQEAAETEEPGETEETEEAEEARE